MIQLVFRFILLIFVFLGLHQFAVKKLKIAEEFTPLFISSLIGLIIFVSGLLNIMIEVAFLIIIFSILNLLYTVINKKFQFTFNLGILYFICMIVYFAILLKGKTFIHYDDFSHWGLVAKEISLTNSFPNFESDLITFQSYPTGSASFIYFISKILGNSEGVFLFAQSILISSSITTLFSFVRNNKLFNALIIVLATLFFLIAYNSPFILLVDTVFPLIGLGITAIILYYADKNNIFKAFLVTLPISSFLIVIKNSSLFFVFLNVLLLLYFLFKTYKINKKSVSYGLAAIAVPYTFSYLWNKHVELVFPSGLESKHSMSISNYESVLQSKSNEDYIRISELFLQRMTNITNTDVMIIIYIISILIIIFLYKLLFNKISFKKIIEWKLAVSFLIIYLLYQLALWLMYMISMPLGEAMTLAGYYRYSYTIIIYIFGVTVVYLIYLNQTSKFNEDKHKLLKMIVLMFIVLCPIILRNRVEEVINLTTFEQGTLPVRDSVKKSLNGQSVSENESYYVYISDNESLNKSGVLSYVLRYELRSTNIKIINEDSLDDSIFKGRKYLLMLEKDKEISDLLEKNGFSNSAESLIHLEN